MLTYARVCISSNMFKYVYVYIQLYTYTYSMHGFDLLCGPLVSISSYRHVYIYIHIYFAFICNIPPMTCIFPSADLPTLGTMYLYIVVRQHHPSGPDSWQMPYRVGTINPAGRLTGCHIELGATVSADIDTARTPRIEPTGIAMTPLRKERCREK